MSTNPEWPVLDAIGELVDWQMEEGLRRGDGPDPIDETDVGEMSEAESERAAAAFVALAEVMPSLVDGLADALNRLAADTLPRLVHGIGTMLMSDRADYVVAVTARGATDPIG